MNLFPFLKRSSLMACNHICHSNIWLKARGLQWIIFFSCPYWCLPNDKKEISNESLSMVVCELDLMKSSGVTYLSAYVYKGFASCLLMLFLAKKGFLSEFHTSYCKRWLILHLYLNEPMWIQFSTIQGGTLSLGSGS